MTEETWRWSASRTARAIRDKEVSVVEVVKASLDRLDATQPVSNAFGYVADDALQRAEDADAAVAKKESLGPLHGVPVAFKLNTHIKGQPTTNGVTDYMGSAADETAPVVTNMLNAGAISLGRTNVPQFSMRWCTESSHWGRTYNPWDSDVTAGGSSGGSAVAVATGAVALAQGNDFAGSVRYPASVCGIAGLRPTLGRIPTWHTSANVGVPMSIQQMSVEGALARTVDDLRLALRVMQAPDPRDPNAVPLASFRRYDQAPVKRVALVVDSGQGAFAGAGRPETIGAVRTAGQWLSDAGYEVEEVSLPALGDAAALWNKIALTELSMAGFVDEMQRAADSDILKFLGLWAAVANEEFGEVGFTGFLAALAERHMVRRRISEFMAEFPLLVIPNSGEPAFPHGADVDSSDRVRELLANQWPSFAVPVLGLPALALPAATATEAAPLGVQIVGRSFDEETVFEAAEVIEQRSGIVTPIDPAREHQNMP
ncbi:amidase [Nocardia vinacea]|uniref:amidase n=1 Tax=Nocardia vinacea TaxID=96468 RepID=UPI00344335FA